MADNLGYSPGSGATVATDDVSAVHFQKVKLDVGGDGLSVPVVGAMPVSDGGGSLTVDGTVGVSGTVPVSGPLTDTQLRAAVVPVSVSNFPASQPVTDNAGSLTVDAPVATPVFVRLSDGAAAIAALPVTDNGGSLTVDGTVTANTGLSQPLTDTQLRASAVPVSMATQTPDVTDRAGRLVGVVSAANLDVALSTRLKPADTLAAVTNLAQLAGTAPTMKAASTASVAADTSLVVAVSPNSPLPAGTNLIGQASLPASPLVVTAVSAANTTVTATLSAVAAQFHYISRIIIERIATTAIAGTAVLTYTSTNLNGWARSTGNAAPVGQQMKDVDEVLGYELKSQTVNTATTIVAPAAGATGIVRITVYYRAAA